MLECKSAGFRAGGAWLVRDINLRLEPGVLHVIAGPNGAGKSTLLRLLSGDLAPDEGEVRAGGAAIHSMNREGLARRRAHMPQNSNVVFGFTALQVAAMGRIPWGDEASEAGKNIARRMLEQSQARHLADRMFVSLSGGERQRVIFARCRAQLEDPAAADCRWLLLDEPTSSLDIRHQHDLLERAREMVRAGVIVCAVIHDLNLCLGWGGRIHVLSGGRLAVSGAPQEVIHPGLVEQVWGRRPIILHDREAQPYVVFPPTRSFSLSAQPPKEVHP
ncbi:MAG: Hemin import ATP-binding protein HmuV [Myxococcota bacterium]|nr:Hemin import ATP-binding protein HmuV [Myxococcota bacterium]